MSAGDVFFSSGEIPAHRRMMFVVSGTVDYVKDDGNAELVEGGEWMCEAVLWTRWTHCGSAVCSCEGKLLELDAEEFSRILSPFGTDHAKQYGEDFVAVLNRTEEADLTDVKTNDHIMEASIGKVFGTRIHEGSEVSDEVIGNVS